MILLGEKYEFTELELFRLEKKFHSIINIPYHSIEDNEVIDKIENLLNSQDIRLIVLNTTSSVSDTVIQYLTKLQFMNFCHKIQIMNIEHFLEAYLQKCYIPEGHTDLHFLEDIKPYKPYQYFIKRILDWTGIILIFFSTFPLMLFTFFKIRSASPGPGFFKQLRMGLNNKEFVCFKFRSMHIDAEKNGVQFASDNDERVFQFGKFIRKYRIDELPQILNVLKGEMHLIGPRPERKYWTDQFEQIIPYYSERHIIMPGITGWAQVMYPYGSNITDAKQKLMYDLFYIKHWSVTLEMKIIWKTIIIIIRKKGI